MCSTSVVYRFGILCADAGPELSQGGADSHVIRGIAEFEGANILMHHGKLARKTCVQRRADGQFGVANEVPCTGNGSGFELPPGKGAAKKVNEHIRERLEVITWRGLCKGVGDVCVNVAAIGEEVKKQKRTDSKMGVDRREK